MLLFKSQKGLFILCVQRIVHLFKLGKGYK